MKRKNVMLLLFIAFTTVQEKNRYRYMTVILAGVIVMANQATAVNQGSRKKTSTL